MGHPFNNYCEHDVDSIIAAARDQYSDSDSDEAFDKITQLLDADREQA